MNDTVSHHKILHLALDEKFVDMAYREFEKVFPGQNKFVVFSDPSKPFRLVKNQPFKKLGWLGLLKFILKQEAAGYDFVVVHMLHPKAAALVNWAPKGVKFIWIGWGYDYYDLIYPQKQDMLGPITSRLFEEIGNRGEKTKPFQHTIKDALRFLAKILLHYNDKRRALRRISLFAPVLPNEYGLLAQKLCEEKLPPLAVWNYGTLEDDFVAGFENECVEGNNILLGNSATFEGNHLDVFDMLSGMDMGGRRIIAPLSYGDPVYKERIIQAGQKMFGPAFDPMIEFIAFTDYVNRIKSCGFVIMNHVRQQALGNIITLLYLGAKVFLREENPIYSFLRSNGAVVFPISSLKDELQERLGQKDLMKNREVLRKIWSRDVMRKKTRNLIASGKKEESCRTPQRKTSRNL